MVRDDPIFDKYLEKDDDGKQITCSHERCLIVCTELEPQRIREDRVDIFIDLGATLEDHGEVYNA